MEGGGFFGIELGGGPIDYGFDTIPSTSTTGDNVTTKYGYEHTDVSAFNAGINIGYRDSMDIGFGYRVYANVAGAIGGDRMSFKVNVPGLSDTVKLLGITNGTDGTTKFIDGNSINFADIDQNFIGLTTSLNLDLLWDIEFNEYFGISPFLGIGLGYQLMTAEFSVSVAKYLEGSVKCIAMGFHLPINVGIDLIFAKRHFLGFAARIPTGGMAAEKIQVKGKIGNFSGSKTFKLEKDETAPHFRITNLMLSYAYKF